MTRTFYEVDGFYGSVKPLRFEADVHDCEVVGELPAALQGRLYRAGPDAQYPTFEHDNVVNGDGMVSMFQFDQGHVRFATRYVQTERYLAERKARRRLYGIYRNPYTDDPSTAGTDRDNTGNTYAFHHAGRLFALREDSWPHQIDPDTLATLPKWNFNGGLKSTSLTAHPKIDPMTGEWWSFGLFAHGKANTDMMLHVIDRNGEICRQEEFQSPYPGLSHDFAVTREHVIFAVMPLTVDEARVKAGGHFYAYDPELPSCWGIMRRDGSAKDIRWFRLPRCFIGHIMNAFTEGSTVHVDATVSSGNGFRFYPDVNGRPTNPADGIPTITRLSFDLSSPEDGAKRTPFPGAIGEMPRLDERFAMGRYRYGYFKTPDGVGRLDWDTMQMTVHKVAGSAQEPVFVPRSPDAPEGDGYLLCVANLSAEKHAVLLVIDALDMSAPPVATVRLPFQLPGAFHGMYVPEAELRR